MDPTVITTASRPETVAWSRALSAHHVVLWSLIPKDAVPADDNASQAAERSSCAVSRGLPASADGQGYRRTACTNALTGDDKRRPATVTRQTLRATAGDTTGQPTTPAKVAVNSGRKQTPRPAATIVRIQSSRSL